MRRAALQRTSERPRDSQHHVCSSSSEKSNKKNKKKFVKYCFCHPKARAVFTLVGEIVFPLCWVISHSLLQTYFALELGCVTCCYLSRPRTLLQLMAAQEHAMATDRSLFLYFYFFNFLFFLSYFFLPFPPSQGAEACSHVVLKRESSNISSSATESNVQYSVTLHGTQSECFTALHLCISPSLTALYSNSWTAWKEITRYFYGNQ